MRIFCIFLAFTVIFFSSTLVAFSNIFNPKEGSYLSRISIDAFSLSSTFLQMEKKTYYCIIYDSKNSINGYIQSFFNENNLKEELIFYNNQKKIILKEILKYDSNLKLIEKENYSFPSQVDQPKVINFTGNMSLNQRIQFDYSKNNLSKTTFLSRGKNIGQNVVDYLIHYFYVSSSERSNYLKMNFKHYISPKGNFLSEKLPSEKVVYTYYINGVKLEIFKINLLNDSYSSEFSSGIIIRNINEKLDQIDSIVKLNKNYIPYRYIKYVREGSKIIKILVYKIINYNHRWSNQFKVIPESNLALLFNFEYSYNKSDYSKLNLKSSELEPNHYINEIPIIQGESQSPFKLQSETKNEELQNNNLYANTLRQNVDIQKKVLEDQKILLINK